MAGDPRQPPQTRGPVGELLAKARTGDVVDAQLIHLAGHRATVHTSDPDDLRRLANHAHRRIHIRTT